MVNIGSVDFVEESGGAAIGLDSVANVVPQILRVVDIALLIFEVGYFFATPQTYLNQSI